MKKSSAVSVPVLVVALAVAAGLFLPAAASAQFVDPYYTYFGVNKIAYDTFHVEDVPLDALPHLLP